MEIVTLDSTAKQHIEHNAQFKKGSIYIYMNILDYAK